MKILVVGAGGVGGYFGARLAAVGSEVFFAVRGRHAAAMRESGLRVLTAPGNHGPLRRRIALYQDV
jgi:2-dehydropantoate 2-reductase